MEAQLRPEFDERERDFIRHALDRYMVEHGIGVPTLQTRLIEADHPRHREIPVSTLQRFLAGKHHTNDHHVAVCHAFAKELPYYGEGRDLRFLGDALAQFCVPPPDAIERALREQRFATEYTGGYELLAMREGRREDASGRTLNFSRYDIPYARMTLKPDRLGKFLQAEEHVFNPERTYPFDGATALFRQHYEGAFVPLDMRGIIVMRNALTRLPKVYWVSGGGVVEAELPFGHDRAIVVFELKMERTGKEGGD